MSMAGAIRPTTDIDDLAKSAPNRKFNSRPLVPRRLRHSTTDSRLI